MRERAVEAHLFNQVRQRGGMCVKTMPTVAGWPDRMVILPGQPIVLVEMKRPKGKLSPLQIEIQRRLERIGHPVATLYTKEEVDLWLEFR
jgi:hypothetical protein